ncbi:MAG: hypothetical protein JSW33_15890 [bacterium]|nr:MAG: hypothetical protein JSW33_15890 [bacterium]
MFNQGVLGYLRGVPRKEGKLLVIYYWASQEREKPYISATLFNARAVIDFKLIDDALNNEIQSK